MSNVTKYAVTTIALAAFTLVTGAGIASAESDARTGDNSPSHVYDGPGGAALVRTQLWSDGVFKAAPGKASGGRTAECRDPFGGHDTDLLWLGCY